MTSRLDENLLPWLTPGSKEARQAVHRAAVLRAYVPLYGSCNHPPQPACSHPYVEHPPTRPIASSRPRPKSVASSDAHSQNRGSSPSSGYGSLLGSESRGTSTGQLAYSTSSPTVRRSVVSIRRVYSALAAQESADSANVRKPVHEGELRPGENAQEKKPSEDGGRVSTCGRFHSTGHSSRPQSASTHVSQSQSASTHVSQPQSASTYVPRPQSASTPVRLERRHRSQLRRPASASPALQSSVAVTGHSYGGGERPPMLLKIHHPPIPQDVEPPPLEWMTIARRAQLHHRPQSSKPQIHSQLPRRKRVSSAPPRLRSHIDQKEESVETLGPPPTTPRNVCGEPPEESALAGSAVEPDVPCIVVHEPVEIIEEQQEEEAKEDAEEEAGSLEEQAPDQDGDEGYVGDTDITDKELDRKEDSDDESEGTRKRRLSRASFTKKKQSLLDGKDLLDEFMRMRHKVKRGKGGDADDNKSMPAWVRSRLMPSRRSCRFELPIDMRLLEGMSPTEYLSNFCVVSDRRQKWFNQAFTTADRDRRGHLGLKELRVALQNVHSDALTDKDVQVVIKVNIAKGVQVVIKVAGLEGKFEVGRKLFHGIAALSERIVSSKIQPSSFSQIQRDLLEEADFESLQWKLRGVSVKEELLHLFNRIST